MDYVVTRNNEDELYHHGVKGMKWGVRRAMKTAAVQLRNSNKPVGSDALNSIKRAGGIRKANKDGRRMVKQEVNQNKAAKNTPEAKAARKAKMKKAVKVGAAVAGTALAAYGAYKVNNALKDKAYKKAYERGAEATKKYMMKINRDKLPYIRDTLNNGHTDHANVMLKNLDRVSDKLSMDNIRYANRHSNTTVKAVKTLLGKNREFTVAELLNMGIKVNGY